MTNKKALLFAIVLLAVNFSKLNASTLPSDSISSKKEKVKTGFGFAAVPALGFDSDIGIKYGVTGGLFWYGNGDIYPKYYHTLNLEWSETTKGSGIKQAYYDSEHLIPGMRLTAEASLLTEKAMDFYGFNGFESWYNKDYEDDESGDYRSRMYYRMDRRLVRFRTDFQGKIANSSFKWFAGWMYHNFDIDSVDVNKLNKGLSSSKKLPYVNGGLYGSYVDWGLISEADKNGGYNHSLRLGLIYDTRDNEPNPNKGIWTEAFWATFPGFASSSKTFNRFIITHRQYIPLIYSKLTLSYRISYQGTISGEVPWYMLSAVQNMGMQLSRDGLGGAKTVRGILRNRVVGEDFVYSNIELRYKFLKTLIFNQNIHLSFVPFLDLGRVTRPYKLPQTTNTDAITYLAQGDTDGWHGGYGTGLFAAVNENFVLGFNYGKAIDQRDGNQGFYIVLNFMY
jgi:outer membrane protein assembly factor BamA